MDSVLDSSLLALPLDDLIANTVAREFWGRNQGQGKPDVTNDLSAFKVYYTKECSHALHDAGRHIAVRTHRDIVEIVRRLRAGQHRDTIKHGLRAKLTNSHENEEELLENSVNLAASLVLMCDCGSRSAHDFSGRTEIRWRTGLSLREYLAEYFGQAPALGHEKVKLERMFVGKNMGRIAGLEIAWTDNLADHLRLTDDDTKVHIFHHASFLENIRENQESLLPPGLAAETLQTLALLFPSTDRDTRKWLLKLPQLDQRVALCGRLKTDLRQIERFHFWRDRLIMLKQVFDEAQPKTLPQWWFDRRNGVQWYTFWVAVLVLVLTIVFGLIQSIEGALQVYASFKALSTPE